MIGVYLYFNTLRLHLLYPRPINFKRKGKKLIKFLEEENKKVIKDLSCMVILKYLLGEGEKLFIVSIVTLVHYFTSVLFNIFRVWNNKVNMGLSSTMAP